MKPKHLLLSLIAFLFAITSIAQPGTAAPTPPARNAANVISIYSGAYTNIAGVNCNPPWGQAGFASATEITVMGDAIRAYPNMNYQGVDFSSNQNVASLDSVHFDIWSSNCTSIGITLVANGAGEREVVRALTLNAWNSIDINLSEYASQSSFPLNAIFQFKFVAKTPASGANVWVDNMYFYTNLNLPSLSNFSIPSALKGAAPFAITAPTSNSSGAFTYTSSNTNVATISGNMITVLDAGSSIITATQAAAGAFSAGSITTNFIVTVPPIGTNAPNPTKPANRVISLFSNSNTNRPVTEWRTSWSGAGALVDTAITGNDIKKYNDVDFVGIEFPEIDATLADSVHISVWTPSAQTFSIKLVNVGGGPLNENIVHFTSRPGDLGLITRYGPKPEQGVWNTYTIPLSLFETDNGGMRLVNRNRLFQILLVGLATPFGDNDYYIDNLYFSSTNNILPVDFTGFEISKGNSTALLKWMVAGEINVKEYIVEKSLNGKDFSTIATVAAAGKDKYSFTDSRLQNGVSYYRIKSLDKDGKFKYSTTKSIQHTGSGKLDYTIYPNPIQSTLFIKNLSGTNHISILDATGKVVYSKLNVTTAEVNINMSNLSKGLYTVLINNGTERKAQSIVVEK
jgi:hypothetical protein